MPTFDAKSGSRRVVLLTATLLLGLALSACAGQPLSQQAAPSPTASTQKPVEAVDIAAGEQDAPVEVDVSGDEGLGVTLREITLAPGASTGVHCHYGQLIAVIPEGKPLAETDLTHCDA